MKSEHKKHQRCDFISYISKYESHFRASVFWCYSFNYFCFVVSIYQNDSLLCCQSRSLSKFHSSQNDLILTTDTRTVSDLGSKRLHPHDTLVLYYDQTNHNHQCFIRTCCLFVVTLDTL